MIETDDETLALTGEASCERLVDESAALQSWVAAGEYGLARTRFAECVVFG
jgi:hypothetical protein